MPTCPACGRFHARGWLSPTGRRARAQLSPGLPDGTRCADSVQCTQRLQQGKGQQDKDPQAAVGRHGGGFSCAPGCCHFTSHHHQQPRNGKQRLWHHTQFPKGVWGAAVMGPKQRDHRWGPGTADTSPSPVAGPTREYFACSDPAQ